MSRVEVEPLGQMIFRHRNHKIWSHSIALIKMPLLILLHEHVYLPDHFNELELVRASTKHGDKTLDERRAVLVSVRHKTPGRRVPDEKIRSRRQRCFDGSTVDEIHERLIARGWGDYVAVEVAVGLGDLLTARADRGGRASGLCWYWSEHCFCWIWWRPHGGLYSRFCRRQVGRVFAAAVTPTSCFHFWVAQWASYGWGGRRGRRRRRGRNVCGTFFLEHQLQTAWLGRVHF